MVSIIISAYKNDKYIIEALNSVVDSAKDLEFEILLGVDNCDVTMNGLIKNFSSLPKQLKIFYFPKVGTYIIRNTLATKTKYDKIIFFDSDDLMSDTVISDTIESLSTHQVARFKYLTFKNSFDKTKINEYTKSNSAHFGCFGINKEIFLNQNGFEPWICAADGEFMWRLESKNIPIKVNKNFGFYYRRHGENLTAGPTTGMNSPLRKHYHNIKNKKIKNNKNEKLKSLNVVDFLYVTEENLNSYYEEFKKLNIDNPYNFEKDFENYTKKKNDAISKVIPKIEKVEEVKVEIVYEHKKIETSIQKTQKQINYEKVNQIFNTTTNNQFASNPNKVNQSQKTRTNSDVLKRIMTKRRNK
jgi:hypothetical protein